MMQHPISNSPCRNLTSARSLAHPRPSSRWCRSMRVDSHAVSLEREHSHLPASHDSTSGSAIVKRLHSCPACAQQPGLIPILDPKLDGVPFAMSLEICKDTTPPATTGSLASPVCELFYFLQGSGSVCAQMPAHPLWEKKVGAGDSLFAPLDSVTVHKRSVEEGEECSQDLTYLRLLLPMQYVLDDIQDPQLVQECILSAIEATSHWESERDQVLSPEAVRNIVNNARQIKDMLPSQSPPSHNHQLSRDATRRRSIDMHTMEQPAEVQQSPQSPTVPSHSSDAASSPAPPSIVKINVLDAPHFTLPNQENRLALVLDPFRDKIPFTFGVEMFPPGHVTMPHVHHQAHELFFVLSGSGTAFCDGAKFPIAPGDCVVFPPGVVHGVNADEKLYCLELMLPNEEFAELVKNGLEAGYDQDEGCVLAAIGC